MNKSKGSAENAVKKPKLPWQRLEKRLYILLGVSTQKLLNEYK